MVLVKADLNYQSNPKRLLLKARFFLLGEMDHSICLSFHTINLSAFFLFGNLGLSWDVSG